MKLNYQKYGEGRPLIILHGLLGSLDNWKTLAKKYADFFTVYTIDQRNHGRSPHAPDMDYKLMADDLKDFIDEHKIKDPHLIGHSMGGKTVMFYLKKYPNSVGKSISADMPPTESKPGHQFIFNALKKLDLSKIEKRIDADKQLKNEISDFGIRQFLLKNLKRSKEGFKWKMNLEGIENNYENILMAVPVEPVSDNDILFLKGQKSNYLEEDKISDYRQWFKNASLDVIPKAGHWLHAEQPDLFFDRSIAYFNEK